MILSSLNPIQYSFKSKYVHKFVIHVSETAEFILVLNAYTSCNSVVTVKCSFLLKIFSVSSQLWGSKDIWLALFGIQRNAFFVQKRKTIRMSYLYKKKITKLFNFFVSFQIQETFIHFKESFNCYNLIFNIVILSIP